MSVPWDQEIFVAQNDWYDVYLRHERGALTGLVVRFSRVAVRKAPSSNPCNCDAYAFTHEKGKGRCREQGKTP